MLCVEIAELVADSKEVPVAVTVPIEVTVPTEVAVAVSMGVAVVVVAAVTLGLGSAVAEVDGQVEYDGKDVTDASSVTDISADTDGAGVRLIDPTGDRELDCSAEEEREGGGDRETLGVPLRVLELVKDWLGLAECEAKGELVLDVLVVLESPGVLVVTWLAVWETDTVLVVELVGLSDSFGVVDERDEADTEALGAVDSDSAGLVEAKAVSERLGDVDELLVTEADPESL
jgi:hypothetical protein